MKFETGIPIPPKSESRKTETKLTLEGMKVNQSFVAEDETTRTRYLQMAKRLGVKVTSRKVDGKGYRIWRTA